MTSSIPETLRNVKALTFDVFGTAVDWHTSVSQELVKQAQEKTTSPAYDSLPGALRERLERITAEDWARFAYEWRLTYYYFTRSFVPGESKWKDVDTHHYDSLNDLLSKWELAGTYTDEEVRSLSLVWHKLKPWDDSSEGIKRLGTRLTTATLSNGNQSLLHDLNTYGDLSFRRIISTADFGAYKPHPSTYLGAAEALGLRPDEVAMVAAHLADLAAARSNGLRTIYVERPQEESWSPEEKRYKEAREWVDIWVADGEDGFLEVAKRLGISE
ncbi:hypothetical protein M426DRAFT_318398 [Hypoxylon sp. CI-4A]|nr:hypothetical protein M426DRAFT_318398 [Hypoxylon sp. CI-4A]